MTETPAPEQDDDEQTYFVFFAANVKANDPGEAVRLLVEQMVETGLRKWTYRVDTLGDTRELIGYFDGHGNPLSLPVVDVPLPDVDADVETASSEPSPTLDTETDDDLTTYAESLTQS